MSAQQRSFGQETMFKVASVRTDDSNSGVLSSKLRFFSGCAQGFRAKSKSWGANKVDPIETNMCCVHADSEDH
eukprot:6476207-Amphidinium_carterae.2